MDRSLFQNIRFENRISNDITVMYRVYLNTDKVVYSNRIKYFYMRHSNSAESLRKRERTIDNYEAALERYSYLKERFPDFMENDICILLMIFNMYFYSYEKIKDYYHEKFIKKQYNQLFSLRLLKCHFCIDDKIKLLLFRISPRLSRMVTKIYLFIRYHKK